MDCMSIVCETRCKSGRMDGDVAPVPGGAWWTRDSAGDDDGGGAVGEHVGGVLG